MTGPRTETKDHRIGSPKPSSSGPSKGIVAPANITNGMPLKSGLMSSLAKVAKARINRGDSWNMNR